MCMTLSLPSITLCTGETTVSDTSFVSEDNELISDQGVSYDDKQSWQAKIDYANSLGLRGLFIWAIDQVNPLKLMP